MENKLSYFEALNRASSALKEKNKDQQALNFLLKERQGWTTTDWLIHMNDTITPEALHQLEQDASDLLEDRPPQYILGYSYFFDQKFNVNEHTLIPRPETEELVALCLAKVPNKVSLKVADIGTGSGAIALSLKMQAPKWQVVATDISEEALKVAYENGKALGCSIEYRLGRNTSPLLDSKWDLIVSNPPYIDPAEKDEMDESVKRYEPETALYAENKGLALYQELAQELPQLTKTTSWLFFEIGYQQGQAVASIFQEAFPLHKVKIYQDISGKDRIVAVEPTY